MSWSEFTPELMLLQMIDAFPSPETRRLLGEILILEIVFIAKLLTVKFQRIPQFGFAGSRVELLIAG